MTTKTKKILLVLLMLLPLFFPFATALAGYELEVGIPSIPGQPDSGAKAGTDIGLTEYVRRIYLFALGAVGGAALLTLVISGVIYMLSDTIFTKEQAKDRIWGAIGGIVLAFAAYLILNTINPDLVRLGSPTLPYSGQDNSKSSGTQNLPSGAALPNAAQQPQSICGNGIIEGSEACDDGSTDNNDGCNSSCAKEPEFCGDGWWQLDRGEECDDGNKVNGDGCDNDCKIGLWAGKIQCLVDNDPVVGFEGESYQACKLSQSSAANECAKKCSTGKNGCILIQDCQKQ